MLHSEQRKGTMARSAEHVARTLEEALTALKEDPSQPVHAHVDNLDVELRVVGESRLRLGDFMAEGGEWKSESISFVESCFIARNGIPFSRTAPIW